MKFDFRAVCPTKLFPIMMVLEHHSENNFLVGGAVRDLLNGKTPNDWDLVTDIPITKLAKEFGAGGFSVSLTGANFLVLNVHFDGIIVEVANFRKDVSCDGRHAEVEDGTIVDDAFRRDFTINALFINTKTLEVVDPTGQGIDDAKANVLRFVGKPKDRIREDFLRVFRFMRFVNKGYEADTKSLRAVRELWNEAYVKTTPERVRAELEKMAGV